MPNLCLSPTADENTAPNCKGPQTNVQREERGWSCPYCSIFTQQSDRRNDHLKQITKLINRTRMGGHKSLRDGNKFVTTGLLQTKTCEFVEGMLINLFDDCTAGGRPGKFALMVCGSLGRREATLFSDIDCFLIIEDEDTRDFYYNAAVKMSTALTTLGGDFTGFKFCRGGLNPYYVLGTADQIIDQITRLDDTHMNGVYKARFIYGSQRVADDWFNKVQNRELGQSDRKLALAELANCLRKKNIDWVDEGWKPATPQDALLDIKLQLYRPVQIVVEALGQYYGIESDDNNTRKTVLGLIDNKKMSVEVGNLIFNMMEDIGKLRAYSHVRAGKEFEIIKQRSLTTMDRTPDGQRDLFEELEVATRTTTEMVRANIERINRFWNLVEAFYREKTKKHSLTHANPFKTKRP